MISRYKAKYISGFNFFSVDLDKAGDLNVLENAVKSSTFFSEHKLVVCKNAFNNKISSDKILGFIKEYSLSDFKDMTLAIVEDSSEKELVLKHGELFKTLFDKNNIVKTVEPLVGAELDGWIQKEFQIRECKINSQTIKNLVQLIGNDSWVIVNEIDKLCAYKRGDITIDDIHQLIRPQTTLSIFDFIDALGSKNRPKAIELLYHELKSGRDPYYILTMITYQFRNLLTIRGLQEKGCPQTEIAQRAKLHPFVVKKAINCLDKFKTEDLKSEYKALLDIDTSSKQGTANLSDSLYKFLLTNST